VKFILIIGSTQALTKNYSRDPLPALNGLHRLYTQKISKDMANYRIKDTIIGSMHYPSIRRVNTFFRRFILLTEIKLSMQNTVSRVSKRLTMFGVNSLYRLGMQNKFFCFECGMNFTKGEMRQTIGDWFGVCRWCNTEYIHTSEDHTKFM
jgi:hypothetical protein